MQEPLIAIAECLSREAITRIHNTLNTNGTCRQTSFAQNGTSMNTSLIELFHRELDRLSSELEQYEDEQDMWRVSGNISNSGGNLALHVVGNLNHFIGHVLGNTGYVRHRDAEFSARDVPRPKMLDDIARTREMITSVLSPLSPSDISGKYPMPPRDEVWTTEFMLLHLLWHLAYHIGQINYHRRLA